MRSRGWRKLRSSRSRREVAENHTSLASFRRQSVRRLPLDTTPFCGAAIVTLKPTSSQPTAFHGRIRRQGLAKTPQPGSAWNALAGVSSASISGLVKPLHGPFGRMRHSKTMMAGQGCRLAHHPFGAW